MKSIADIFGMVQDGTLTTREQAAALVDAEVVRMAGGGEIDAETARRNLLANIGYCTGYCSHEHADRIMDLFQTEHPIFGKTHPTPEEICRLGMERGRASRERKLIDDQKGSE
jgi:hypothetical protein